MSITGLHIGGILPLRLPSLLKPRIQGGLQGAMILASLQLAEVTDQRASGDNVHR